MQRFTQLFDELDGTTRTNEKVAALVSYFAEAPPADAAWALYFLTGRTLRRVISTRLLREFIAEYASLPLWLVEESYDAVGDLAEALALLAPDVTTNVAPPLHEVVAQRVAPLRGMTPEQQRQLVLETWRLFDTKQRLVWHKLITGEFRIGVAQTLVVRALAQVAGLPAPIMAHRLMGAWEPTVADYLRLTGDAESNPAASPGQPYPFYLAYPLESPLESLGTIEDWQIEWKWDGIRAQLLRRAGQTLIWSRGEDLMTDRFPELRAAAEHLPEGVVLDGEILAWRDDRPLSFGIMQRRIGRKQITAKVLAEAPAVFMGYDLLELAGRDLRPEPLATRRMELEKLFQAADDPWLRLSPLVVAESWDELRQLHLEARERAVEGFMIKRRSAPYGVGRQRGDWWKWKVDPYNIDAVLIYAQSGHGRRASLYSDYTFGVWQDGELVPVAKAYSGLTDAEIREVDAFIRRNTLSRFGPVRVVKPELVFELAFEGIQASTRHKAGIALRFPRMARQRTDKRPEDANTLADLQAMLSTAQSQVG